ncbi:Ig-like domain-containing protein [Streptomyces melanosporofaciens]|uniref:Ig-like domain (Group 3) n=1 Tax=Streptomyces melanosporofaciens TaxID=67327 RepID=A0A1H4M2A0_STRMJ|nr:Ig-like domain-containing protein [Streptomyces melanosporofaciens]SEB76917.1 Ig-like domain (group 3) [Streptomyces melanosporofaciens]
MASPTVTLVTASPNPAVLGQSVTLTATVIPLGAGTPTGTVTFVVSGGPPLTGTLSGGTASVTASGLSGGTHIVTATYNGEANFTASTGTTAALVIPASTTTTVTSAPDPSTLGQSVTFTATVTPVAPGAGTPAGTVTFIIGGSGGGTFTQPLSGGMATLSLGTLGVGTHAVVVIYSGSTDFLPSTGIDTHTVNPGPAATTTTLTSSVNPSVFGQPVTYTATVTPNPPATGTPTGTVTFTITDPDGITSTQPLVGGTATFTTSGPGTGSHTVTATYNGDTNFAPSTSAPLTQVVSFANSRTSISSNPNPSEAGALVDFVAFVEAIPPGDGTPTGPVSFTLSNGVDTITSNPTLDTNGFAFFEVALPAGDWEVEAVYEGDANFGASGVSEYIQVVTEPDSGTVTTTTS